MLEPQLLIIEINDFVVEIKCNLSTFVNDMKLDGTVGFVEDAKKLQRELDG